MRACVHACVRVCVRACVCVCVCVHTCVCVCVCVCVCSPKGVCMHMCVVLSCRAGYPAALGGALCLCPGSAPSSSSPQGSPGKQEVGSRSEAIVKGKPLASSCYERKCIQMCFLFIHPRSSPLSPPPPPPKPSPSCRRESDNHPSLFPALLICPEQYI